MARATCARVLELAERAIANATENVSTGRSISRAISAATALLSMPPDRNMPERHVGHQPQPDGFLEQRRGTGR